AVERSGWEIEFDSRVDAYLFALVNGGDPRAERPLRRAPFDDRPGLQVQRLRRGFGDRERKLVTDAGVKIGLPPRARHDLGEIRQGSPRRTPPLFPHNGA